MKTSKKLALGAIVVFGLNSVVSNIENLHRQKAGEISNFEISLLGEKVAYADTSELRKQLKDIFGDTALVQPEQVDTWVEKGKEKSAEIKQKVEQNLPTWKKNALDSFEESKEWIRSYSGTQGISSVIAEGFLFKDSYGQEITSPVYLVVENKTIGKPKVYFASQSGEKLGNFTFEDVFNEVSATHRFLRIASPRKVRSQIFHSLDIFQDNAHYVWAELELDGVKIVRPVPVSKETFKMLKKLAEGTEFKALYQK